MKRAFIAVRTNLPERLEAVKAGCRALGYELAVGDTSIPPTPADVCISWNRFGRFGMIADRVARAGGRVIVLENGYCGRDTQGRQYLAVARDQHLGAGHWGACDDASRWECLGIELRPWRTGGRHVVVCLSRGFGSVATAMPEHWPNTIQRKLQMYTSRPIIVRPHPEQRGVKKPRPLEEDLADAHAVVVWASNAGTEALIAGVPVFHAFPSWLLAGAANDGIHEIENPRRPDRLPAFIRLAWAQWTLEEISTGEPFDRLLRRD